MTLDDIMQLRVLCEDSPALLARCILAVKRKDFSIRKIRSLRPREVYAILNADGVACLVVEQGVGVWDFNEFIQSTNFSIDSGR